VKAGRIRRRIGYWLLAATEVTIVTVLADRPLSR
jgi:hypothetical protein